MRRIFALIVAALLAGCAAASPEAIQANDPFEPENRAVYSFDQRFDKYVVLPLAWFYLEFLPRPLQRGLRNFFVNLDTPDVFANDVLQGEFSNAANSLGRFTLNSTIGLGGFVDVATPAGLGYHPTDFGQTLERYGVPEGPFLVLPLIGPDPPRDLLGDAVDLTVDPLLYLPPGLAFSQHLIIGLGVNTVSPFETHTRAIVLRRELESGSVDPYVTMRNVYRQMRAHDAGVELPDAGEPSGK